MPTRYMPLEALSPAEVRRIPGLPAMKERKTTFPKRAAGGAAEARAALRRWQEQQPAPAAPRNPEEPIEAVRLTRANLAKLRAVAESDVGPAEILNQKLTPKTLFGTLYSALTTYEFMQLQAEYKRRKATGRGVEETERQWQQVVAAAQAAYAAAGLRVQPADLDRFVRELTASAANLNAVVRIAGSGVAVDRGTALTTNTKVAASFMAVAEKVIDAAIDITPIPDLCDEPIKQGSFTKHFSKSVSLSVKIKYWCPTWTNPFKTCTKTVTLAGVSFTIGVNVGYKVTCCGATAWGQGYAQACATIVGISVCASCSATIIGVAGVSRTPVSSGCLYGLGINAVLQCKLAGATILNVSYPFGWTISGPCPPAGACA
jgi:hypothetical protein